MSTVPFCTSGMRFCDVTGWYLMSSLAMPSCFWMSASTRWQISMWKPANLPSPSVYDRAPDDSRTPIVTAPLSLIFDSVSGLDGASGQQRGHDQQGLLHADSFRGTENVKHGILGSGLPRGTA